MTYKQRHDHERHQHAQRSAGDQTQVPAEVFAADDIADTQTPEHPGAERSFQNRLLAPDSTIGASLPGSNCKWAVLRLAIQQSIDQRQPMGDVHHPALLVADFPLDVQRAVEFDIGQSFQKLRNVHFALAQRHFLAPLALDRRPVGVLQVHGADVLAQNLHGPDRVAHVVEQHVGRVEVHLQVRALQVVERQPQQVGRLLARFERQSDALVGGELAGLGQRVQEWPCEPGRRVRA